MKKWKPIGWENCDLCGDDVEVFTTCTVPNQAFDGDIVRCVMCGQKGWVSIDEEADAWVNWESELHVFNPYEKSTNYEQIL